jgi:hypothetical protein
MLALPPSAAAAEEDDELDELAAPAADCACTGVAASEAAARTAIAYDLFMTVLQLCGLLALYKM